jgi:hypothetical protein
MNFFANMSLFFVHFFTESYAGQSGSPILRLLSNQHLRSRSARLTHFVFLDSLL